MFPSASDLMPFEVSIKSLRVEMGTDRAPSGQDHIWGDTAPTRTLWGHQTPLGWGIEPPPAPMGCHTTSVRSPLVLVLQQQLGTGHGGFPWPTVIGFPWLVCFLHQPAEGGHRDVLQQKIMLVCLDHLQKLKLGKKKTSTNLDLNSHLFISFFNTNISLWCITESLLTHILFHSPLKFPCILNRSSDLL